MEKSADSLKTRCRKQRRGGFEFKFHLCFYPKNPLFVNTVQFTFTPTEYEWRWHQPTTPHPTTMKFRSCCPGIGWSQTEMVLPKLLTDQVLLVSIRSWSPAPSSSTKVAVHFLHQLARWRVVSEWRVNPESLIFVFPCIISVLPSNFIVDSNNNNNNNHSKRQQQNKNLRLSDNPKPCFSIQIDLEIDKYFWHFENPKWIVPYSSGKRNNSCSLTMVTTRSDDSIGNVKAMLKCTCPTEKP